MYFSIIVPVYKVEKYIAECVNSVLSQTFDDYELILVDDGSPDSCPVLCDEFATKDKRVKVVHKVNGGLSDARNSGLSVAQGEYVIFIDSDDYWDDRAALEKLKTLIDKYDSDVVTWRYKKFDESMSTLMPNGKNAESNEFKIQLESRNFISSANTKAIKRRLFIQNELSFNVGVYSEDVEWSARLILVANEITPSNLDFYIYRQREGSITHSIGDRNVSDLKSHIEKMSAYIKEASDVKKALLSRYMAEEFTNFVVTLSGYSDYKKEIDWIKKQKEILKWASSKRSRLLRLMMSFIGVRLSILIIRKIR